VMGPVPLGDLAEGWEEAGEEEWGDVWGEGVWEEVLGLQENVSALSVGPLYPTSRVCRVRRPFVLIAELQ